MKALLKAIHTSLHASVQVSSRAAGGIYAGRAAQAALMPYIVWSRRSARTLSRDTGGAALERVTVRFEAYSTGAVDSAEALGAVERLFAASAPVLESGTVIQVAKAADGLRLASDTNGEGREVWRGVVDLEFMVQRDPGD
ncbi:MAG: DUF3168 domain-containing protein [Planctomycetes bacterium]|nr:DUF3168 domain-containing protein [Planctomycetota bacterium]